MAGPAPNPRKDYDEALGQVTLELAYEEANLAASLAAAPNQKAWLENFRACLAQMLQGPPPAGAAAAPQGTPPPAPVGAAAAPRGLHLEYWTVGRAAWLVQTSVGGTGATTGELSRVTFNIQGPGIVQELDPETDRVGMYLTETDCHTDIAHSPGVRIARLNRASTPSISLKMTQWPPATTPTSAGPSAGPSATVIPEATTANQARSRAPG
ncbi:hypothetical protein QBC32DRAFT_54854 [Pseudoneurospora amorphoporcata]|uniref:Uncharacterized protein n=1 Tax=Pseudoneurospora amorphoporcata TaxID=241081 RepID=A0AAN6NMU6_9PEZI|nr:hypothetical protein QBC32DRAFT_54854 [Pseudoneurospora amorphoporcata]